MKIIHYQEKKIGKSYKVKEKHIKLALSIIKKYPHILIQGLWIMLRKKYKVKDENLNLQRVKKNKKIKYL